MSWQDAPLSRHPLGPAGVQLIHCGYKVLLLGGADGKLPLGARAGQPNGFISATDDLGELEERLRLAGERATGLGIVVGGESGPVVVDADGPCAVARLREILGEAWERTPRQTTRKGVHVFFGPDPTVHRAVRGIKVDCTCGGGGCGIDVLGSTAEGGPSGYVAIAPSPGKKWEWPESGLLPVASLPSLLEGLRKELPHKSQLTDGTKPLPAGWEHAPLRLHPLGQAATQLATRGYRVLLMGGEGKVPLGKSCGQPNGYHSATDDLGKLERRLRLAGGRATGLGIVVGGENGPVVIDADGPCAERTLFDLVGDALAVVPRERTRKGMHLFFRPDPTIRRAVRGIPVDCTCGRGCGIDILGSSSDGAASGNVTVAPSPGKTWSWPDGGLPEPSPLPGLPQVLQDYAHKAVPTDQAPVVLTEADRQAARGVLGNVLDEALDTVRAGTPGQRHSILLAAAQRVGQVLGAAGYDAHSDVARQAIAALIEASEASGHDHMDAKRTAQDGVRWGAARPRPMAVGREAEIARWVAGVVEALKAIPVPEAGNLDVAQDAIARALLDENSGVIQASTGVGKTHLLKQLGRASASRPRRGMWPSRVEPEPEPEPVPEEPRQLSLWSEPEPEPEPEPESEPELWPIEGEGVGDLGRFASVPPWEIPPLAAFFPTRELRDDFASAVGLPSEAVHCGRHELTEEDRQRLEATPRWERGQLYLAPWTCPILPAVRPISERNHILMASACADCSHGFAAQLLVGVPMLSGEDEDESRGRARLVRKLEARGLRLNEVTACPYILAVSQERQETVLAATHAAATDSMGRMALSVYRRGDGEGEDRKSLARTMIYDEEPTWVKKVLVHRRDVTEWRERADEICRGLREKGETQILEDWRRELFLDTLEKWRKLFNQQLDKFERAIWSLDKPNLGTAASVLPNLLELCEWVTTVTDRRHGLFSDEPDLRKAKKKAGKTALWEKVKIRWDGTDLDELIAPLRALMAFRVSHKVGADEVVDTPQHDGSITRTLVVWDLTATGEIALGKERVKILTATPSQSLLAATQAQGGTHTEAVLPQPVRILATYDAGWGVSHEEQGERRKEQAVGLLGSVVPQLAQGLGVREDEVGLISHKPWIERLRALGGISERRSRWWGAEQGVNTLEDVKALLIGGLPAIPTYALRDAYCAERFFALTAGADESEWPIWSQDEPWVLRPTVTVSGQEVEWPQGLPENEHLRAWVLKWYSRRMAQALGRTRALQRAGEEAPAVVILGPCPDLGEFGFHVTPWVDGELRPSASAGTRGAVRRAEAEARVAAIMLEMRQEGVKETCRTIAERAKEVTGKGCGPGVVRRVRLREASGESLEQIVQTSARVVGVALREGTVRKLRDDLPARVWSLVKAFAHARPVRLTLRPKDADARGALVGAGCVSRRGPPAELAG